MKDTETVVTVSRARAEELAERCLRTNWHLALRSISCKYLNGVLVLQGCVETYYLKQVAQAAMACLEGIERIDNQIQVVTSARRPRR